MTTNRKILCGVYAAIAAAALVATWAQNLAYSGSPSTLLKAFFGDLKTTPASRSITVDLLLFLLAAAILMVVEARKHAIPYVWVYIIGSAVTAISFTFPLFLIARERRLAATDQAGPTAVDVVALSAYAALVAAGVIFIEVS